MARSDSRPPIGHHQQPSFYGQRQQQYARYKTRQASSCRYSVLAVRTLSAAPFSAIYVTAMARSQPASSVLQKQTRQPTSKSREHAHSHSIYQRAFKSIPPTMSMDQAVSYVREKEERKAAVRNAAVNNQSSGDPVVSRFVTVPTSSTGDAVVSRLTTHRPTSSDAIVTRMTPAQPGLTSNSLALPKPNSAPRSSSRGGNNPRHNSRSGAGHGDLRFFGESQRCCSVHPGRC